MNNIKDSVEVGEVLRPFLGTIRSYNREEDVKDYPLFKVVSRTYGTQGYTYKVSALYKGHDEYKARWRNKWCPWHRSYNHIDLQKYFRIATKAEMVLYQ